MRIQPNGGKVFKPDSHYEHNDLYKRFKKVFKIILDGDDPHKYSEDPGKWYVPQKEIEIRINDIIHSESDSLQYLLGLTGIGKSTVLRKCTRGIRNPVVNGEVLIIPVNFDNRNFGVGDIEKQLTNIWVSNADFIKEEYNVSYSKKNLIKFIKSHSRDLLYNGTLDIDIDDEEKLKNLMMSNPYGYSLELFKYFFYHSKFKKLLLVVDDIESANHDAQVKLVEVFYRAYNCIRNVKNKERSVNAIISIRPNTHKLMRKSDVIKSHYFSTPVKITAPVPLVDIFKIRFNEVLSRADYSHIKDTKEWDRTLDVLLHLCDAISDKYSNRFIALFNYNVRRTLVEFNQIIVNRRWFQKSKIPNPSFKIDEFDYAISEAAVYKVLGMKNSDFYPVENTCLPNLLYNKFEPTHDLILIYIVKYFLLNNKSTNDLDEAVDKNKLINDFSSFFPQNNIKNIVDDCLDFGINNKLFEDNITEFKKHIIFITPRAKELYQMIGEKNLALQLFRDDLFQEYSNNNRRNSLTIHLTGVMLFEEMVYMSQEIYEWETKIVNTFILNDMVDKAIACFGEKLFSEYLLLGISNSIDAYFRDKNNSDFVNVKDLLFGLETNVQKLSKKYVVKKV